MILGFEKNKYATYYIEYRLVFCTRRSRKIFKFASIRKDFKEALVEICNKHNFQLISADTKDYTADLRIKCNCDYSPKQLHQIIRKESTKILAEKHPEIITSKSIWTKNFFVTTNYTINCDDIIADYIESQKRIS